MNIDLKTLPDKILPILIRLKRSAVFIFIILFLLIFSFLVFRINLLMRSEPTDDSVTEKLKTVQRPRIDKTALDKIQSLQDNNVDVQSLFKQARDNPFSE